MDDADLTKLLERCALGDRRSFDRLYERTSGKLFALAIRILQDRQEAEDAVQDAYVKIWRYAERYAVARAGAMTWMAAIARNVCIDRLRAKKSPTATLDAAEAVADTTLRPDEAMLAKGSAKQLLDCINGLEPAMARLVRIAYFGGVTYAGLAERDGVPLGTVKSRMRRALGQLRTCLGR
ncbi:MAG: sigma-70 family RNA polymerase sigma factor [Pseudomonadota bacterium]